MDRKARLFELYKLPFPDDLFELWELASELNPEQPLRAFHEALGVTLVGPFEVLAGRFDGIQPRFSPYLHWRFALDLPEFFTAMNSDYMGFHWGYWFDDPGHEEPVVAAFSTNASALSISISGWGLFESLRNYLEWRDQEAEEALHARAESMGADERAQLEASREIYAALRQTLMPHAPGTATGSAYIEGFDGVFKRPTVVDTRDGMGIVVPESAYKPLSIEPGELVSAIWQDADPKPWADEALELLEQGYPGAALQVGRELWNQIQHTDLCHELLEAAYEALDRPILLEVAQAHRAYPDLPNPDILSYDAGDYLELDEALAHPLQVQRLDLGGQWLKSLPESLGELRAMEVLELWGNELRDLPQGLLQCEALTTVHLHLNKLTAIPPALFGLPQLEILLLARNQIKDVPDGIARLRSLKRLDLHENLLYIGSISPSLFELPELEFLSLAKNRLKRLPLTAGQLPKLRTLHLQNNDFQQLPEALFGLEQIERLDLSHNRLSALPQELSGWSRLSSLKLSDNPLSPSERYRILAALPEVEVEFESQG